jgi:translocation and assembly module TamB
MDSSDQASNAGIHHRKNLWQSKLLRVAAWVAAGVTFVVVLALVAVTVLVNTDGVHRYLLGLAQRKAGEALGVRVDLQNFTLHPGSLSLDLYGIRISGAAPYQDPPLLQADHIKVGVRIISVLGREWHFDKIQIDHPVAWLLVDEKGNSNLPVFESSGSSHTDIFEMGIRNVSIDRGEVYYNSRPSSVAADLHDLEFNSAFNPLFKRYAGKLSYDKGQIVYGAFRPLEHAFELEFEATPTTFTLKNAKLSSGASQAIISATLANYASPSVQGKYQIVLDGAQAVQILQEPSMPAGAIRTSGSLRYQQSATRAAIEMLQIDGDLSSSRLTFHTSSGHGEVTNVVGHYSLANGNAFLRDLRANVLGGALSARGKMEAIGGNSHSSFQARLQNLGLANLRQAFASPGAAKDIELTGQANATATAEWGKSTDELVARAELSLDGQANRSHPGSLQTVRVVNAGGSPGNGTVLPIHGEFHTIYSNNLHELTFNNSTLKSSQSSLSLNGTVSRNSSLAVNLQANDLSEIATFVNLFRAPAENGSPLDLTGRASFQGNVRGSTATPDLTGNLTAQNLEYDGSRWTSLQTGVELSPARASLQNLRLLAVDRGQIAGSASAGLEDWSFTQQSPIQLELNASELNLATLAKLSGQQLPLTGTLNASAHIHGQANNPTGNGTLSLSGASAYGEPVSSLKVDFNGSGNQVQATLAVQLPSGSIQGRVSAEPQARTFTARIDSSGIDLTKLQAITTRGINVTGVVAVQASGQGSFDNPSVDANLQIPKLSLGGQVFSAMDLRAHLANHVANADLATSISNASLHGKAQVNLTGDYLADASFDTQALPLEPFLAAYAPDNASGVSGQAEIHAQLHGPLKDKNQLEAHVSLPVLKLAYGNSIELAAASPIQADYRNGLITLQPATIRGTDTDLEIQGSFPVNSGAPMSLKAQGNVDLQIAQLFDSDLRSSGQLKLNIDSHGALAGAALGGEIDIVDAAISTTTSPVGLQHANGVLKLTTDRLEVAKFDGTVGGGSVTAQGAVVYRPNLQFNLGLSLKGARILYPQGVRETANANLRLTGTTEHSNLGGSVDLADLSFTDGFDLSTVLNQFSGSVEIPSGPGLEQNMDLNFAVNSSSNANLVSRTLSVEGTANLQVRGTLAEPVILGRVNLSGGDVILNGSRFVLNGGTIQFIDPSMTEPVLNVSVTTTIQEYKIDLRFQGPTDQLRTQYTSDPSLPSADIINLLAFGQTTEASAMNSTPGNQQAEGLVASQVSSQVTSRISKAAGISQLSISPVLAGSSTTGPPGANLTIQQRVTGKLFVTFSTNVATTQGQTIQGQYQISPRVAVSATRDPNGGFAVDTLIKKSW